MSNSSCSSCSFVCWSVFLLLLLDLWLFIGLEFVYMGVRGVAGGRALLLLRVRKLDVDDGDLRLAMRRAMSASSLPHRVAMAFDRLSRGELIGLLL